MICLFALFVKGNEDAGAKLRLARGEGGVQPGQVTKPKGQRRDEQLFTLKFTGKLE